MAELTVHLYDDTEVKVGVHPSAEFVKEGRGWVSLVIGDLDITVHGTLEDLDKVANLWRWEVDCMTDDAHPGSVDRSYDEHGNCSSESCLVCSVRRATLTSVALDGEGDEQ